MVSERSANVSSTVSCYARSHSDHRVHVDPGTAGVSPAGGFSQIRQNAIEPSESHTAKNDLWARRLAEAV
jgi:hypothetical protein